MTASVKLSLKADPRSHARSGHPWIYRSQLKTVPENGAGALADVLSAKGAFIGRGYYNPASEIAVRLLSRQPVSVDKAFFAERVKKAASYRKKVVSGTNACRLISSEADGLPGLIVDRYADTLVVQFLTLGMERLKNVALEALEEVLSPRGIYERSDTSSRRIEGLEDRAGWVMKNCDDSVEVYEKNIKYHLRFAEGHKTGLYLDQRENRLLLPELGGRGEALDAFCYEGGFGLHLAAAGYHVLGIDAQADAIKRAEENRRLNGLSEGQLSFRTANVFDELKAMDRGSRRFDLIVLDPPSFVKKKSALEGALAGTKEILLRSMKMLNEDGFLAVFSCSYHVDDNLLMQTSMSAAHDVKKKLRVVRFLKQAADHPIDPFIPETYYLKGFLFSVFSS